MNHLYDRCLWAQWIPYQKHFLHPLYLWNKNMGYGSPDHLAAIAKYGPCNLHRFSYAPMKNMTNKI